MMKEIFILGVKINDISLQEAIDLIANFLASGQKGYLTTPNPEICLQSYKSKQFRRIMQNAWISIPDGFGLKIGARILGDKLNNTTTGVDLCQKVIQLAEQNNYSVLFIGGKQETGERTIDLLKTKYPKLKIDYINGGHFDSQGNFGQPNLISQINLLTPDIIFVCLGAPKQEYFMANNLENMETKLMLGVGGSIDFLSGEVKRAPEKFRQLGLEWLWRLIHEPWRWQRIIKAVIIFPLACLRWRFGNLFIYRKNVTGFIINQDKQILITKHAKLDYWQIPQGGVKNAKTTAEYEQAILREMKEELGTDTFKILKTLKNCYKYNWPKINGTNWDQYKGQRQTLYLLQFLGTDQEIQLDPHEHAAYEWINAVDIIEKVSDYKKPLVKIALANFKDYL